MVIADTIALLRHSYSRKLTLILNWKSRLKEVRIRRIDEVGNSLRENLRSVGQNRQISEMTGEFCQFAGQFVRRKIIIQKNTQTVFWVTGSSMDENCTYFLCILTIFHIQIKQNPIIFVRHFSFLSNKNFQTVGQLSSNYSEDFTKTGVTDDI